MEGTENTTQEVVQDQPKGYTMGELEQILKHLSVLISVNGAGCSFECSKNMVAIERIREKHEKCLQKLDDQHYFKDDDGKPIKYVVQLNGPNSLGFAKDENDNHIVAKDGDPCMPRVDIKAEYTEALVKLNSELYDIKFKTLQESEIEKLMKPGQPLDGINIKNLFGNVIV